MDSFFLSDIQSFLIRSKHFTLDLKENRADRFYSAEDEFYNEIEIY